MASAEAVSRTPFSVEIVSTAYALQQANGVRLNDFCRYRRFLSRKIRRVRRALDLRQGRNRFVKKPIPPGASDERFVLLLLLLTERAWSYGMQLKAEIAAASEARGSDRARCIGRFRKAVALSKQLEELCAAQTPASGEEARIAETTSSETRAASVEEDLHVFCGRTRLEARAYRQSMLVALLQEQEKWQEEGDALEELRKSYSQLKRLSSTHVQREQLFRQKLVELDPLVRLCAYHRGGFASLANSRGKVGAGLPAATSCPTDSTSLNALQSADPGLKAEKVFAGVEEAFSDWNSHQVLPTAELLRLEERAPQDRDFDELLSRLTEHMPEDWVSKYADAAERFRACVDLVHKEAIARPEDASLLRAESVCLATKKCIELERDVVVLLVSLLRLVEGRTKKAKAPSEQLNAHLGHRSAGLVLENLGRLREEEGLSEKKREALAGWSFVASESRSLCLAAALACSEELKEAFGGACVSVVLKAIRMRTKAMARQSAFGEDEPQRRLHAFFCLIQVVLGVEAEARLHECLLLLLREKNLFSVEVSGAHSEQKKLADKAVSAELQRLNSDLGRLLVPEPQPIPCKPELFDLAVSSLKPPVIESRTGGEGKLKGIFKSLWKR